MHLKKYTWHKIADSVEELSFNENNLLETEAGNKKICIIKNKNSIQACAHKCPHAGGFMDEGYIDTLGNIVCPVHRYKFSLQNGRNTSGEGYFLKIFPVEIRQEGVFVGTEDSGLFGWLK
jgi:nitrite reductase/ring-hydroxylating ferredoxin subunit